MLFYGLEDQDKLTATSLLDTPYIYNRYREELTRDEVGTSLGYLMEL
jgi:hypothetical protein